MKALAAIAGGGALLVAAVASAPERPLRLAELVPGAVITQPFGCTGLELEPVDPGCPGRHFHSGVDLAAPSGTPVHAAAGGVARVVDGPGYGLHVVVTHERGVKTLYCHLSSALVQTGDRVGGGEVIGLVGSSGMSTGPHLHFEVRLEGSPIDPLDWLTP